MKNRGFKRLAIIFGVILTLVMAKDTYELWKVGDIVELEASKNSKLEQENEKLRAQIRVASSSASVEKYARNILSWVRNGEKLVILPKNDSPLETGDKILDLRPNWKKWWDLVF